MYVNSLACVRVKGDDSEGFRVDSVVRKGCTMSPWIFNVYMDSVMKEVKMGMGRRGECRLPGLLYADGFCYCEFVR